MNSIRVRLLRAFVIIIAVFSLASTAFFFLGVWNVRQYKSISDTMIAEYQLADNTAKLIDAFNTRVQSAGTNFVESQSRIDQAKSEIRRLTTFLDDEIKDQISKSNYLGFKGTIEKFTKQIDDSLLRFEQESIKDYFSDYNEANKLYGFVRETGTLLIFSQLEYASSIRDSINQVYMISIVFGVLAFVSIFVACIIYVFRFSHKLIIPLKSLDIVAQKIADGDANATIGDELVIQRDEIGSLARSYKTMITKLFLNINKLDASNKEIAQSTKALESKNDELERINKLMVDRELKMIELKKEIGALKGQK